ncbi:hypothetical protein MUU47_10645 [Scandinavium sp. H11S7]|uniref:Replication protein n=1 Tax=Scandinavium hiltneri TaxID=2926519 RepID=A0ABT2E138_9ENTR|nr:hypothetical protein [Scandinavium hiltneri]MCS2161569.1 hypothetical protein [Scandinavium hiltneri]
MFNLETIEQAQSENVHRVKIMRKKYESKPVPKIKKLITVIEDCSVDTPCKSMACAKCQRQRRQKYIEKWLPYFENHTGYKFVTLIFYQDMISNNELTHWSPDNLIQRLGKALKRMGFCDPVIGGFEMDYHRYTHNIKESYWLPHFHLLVPDEPDNLEKLRNYMLRDKNLHARKGRRNRPIRIDDIDEIAKVLSYCVKGFWQEIPWFINDKGLLKKVKNKKRITNKTVFVKSLLLLDQLKESHLNFSVNVQNR